MLLLLDDAPLPTLLLTSAPRRAVSWDFDDDDDEEEEAPFDGVEAAVGVVISMGSPGVGEDGDILIVGVRMGTVRAPIASSGSVAKLLRWMLSVAVAIGAEPGQT